MSINMAADESLAIDAMSLTDGADIHYVAGLVGMYRAVMREGLDAGELEHELRCYVIRKRLRQSRSLRGSGTVSVNE